MGRKGNNGMKVTVDGKLCTGHGRCYTVASQLFSPDDQGFSSVRDEVIQVPASLEDAARVAAGSCPEYAITLLEESA